MNVPRFYPSMLPVGVVDPVFIISIASGITSHVGTKFEWIISVLRGETGGGQAMDDDRGERFKFINSQQFNGNQFET